MAPGLFAKVAGAWVEIGAAAAGMEWAEVTGGTVTTVNNPDGSVDHVHTFTAGGTLTVTKAGYARVLACGAGGSNGLGAGGGGGGGDAREAIMTLPVGSHTVTVGTTAASNTDQNGTTGGHSSLGSLLWAGGGSGGASYGYPPYGPYNPWLSPALGALRGSTGEAGSGCRGLRVGTTPGPGHVSDISGSSVEYGKGGPYGSAPTLPGQGCRDGNNAVGIAGQVVVRVQITPPTASGVVASGGMEGTYTGNGTNGTLGQNYKVHQFTTAGSSSLVVTQGGEADVFLISGGGAKDTARPGSGGRVFLGRITLAPGTVPVVVGAGAVFNGTAFGAPSSLGGIATGAAAGYAGNTQSTGAGSTVANPTAGLVSYITGSAVEYGKVGATTPGSSPVADNSNGIAGAVIVRYEV